MTLEHDRQALIQKQRLEYLKNPDAYVCSVSQCCSSYDEFVEGEFGTGHRAAQQRRFADEIGVRFCDVHTRRVYIRIYTRQEAWDEYGRFNAMDNYEGYDDWLDVMYRDQADRLLEAQFPARVPDGWEPYEEDPHWWFSHRNDVKAIAAWQCE